MTSDSRLVRRHSTYSAQRYPAAALSSSIPSNRQSWKSCGLSGSSESRVEALSHILHAGSGEGDNNRTYNRKQFSVSRETSDELRDTTPLVSLFSPPSTPSAASLWTNLWQSSTARNSSRHSVDEPGPSSPTQTYSNRYYTSSTTTSDTDTSSRSVSSVNSTILAGAPSIWPSTRRVAPHLVTAWGSHGCTLTTTNSTHSRVTDSTPSGDSESTTPRTTDSTISSASFSTTDTSTSCTSNLTTLSSTDWTISGACDSTESSLPVYACDEDTQTGRRKPIRITVFPVPILRQYNIQASYGLLASLLIFALASIIYALRQPATSIVPYP